MRVVESWHHQRRLGCPYRWDSRRTITRSSPRTVKDIFDSFSEPAYWAAVVALTSMEIVLGIDNLIFISILTNKLPEQYRTRARRIGIGLALVLRLVLLSLIAFIV